MFNLMLDRLPDNYKGHLIRTDFRIGVQIMQALHDQKLHEDERMSVALSLLYGVGIPQDAQVAREGLEWFLRGGAPLGEDDGDESGKRGFDFDIDHTRIWSGFRRVFSIDLSTARFHWFQFLALLSDLDGCAFTDVVGYRLADIRNMPPAAQAAYSRMKRRFALPEVYSNEEQQKIDRFEEKLGG